MNTPTRILIVEDDAILATELQETLTQMGYQVSGLAATGKEAVKSAIAQNPDIILMDIRLRGAMTGIQTVEQIHQQLDIPVVYLTAFADEALLQQAKITEAYAYLVKPVHDRELRACLEMTLYRCSCEHRLQHLNQILRAVRDINHLISHEHDEQDLIEQACQILFHKTSYRYVWIGQSVGDHLKPLAQAGDGQKLIARIAVSATPEQGLKLPGTEAANTRSAVVCNDMLLDERFAPWREEVEQVHFSSTVAVPILLEESLFGVLNVYSDQANFFVAEEIDLLLELAGDIAFGLKAIDGEAKRKQAEKALKQSNELNTLFMKYSPIYVFIKEVSPIESRVLTASENYSNMIGIQGSEMVGKTMDELFPAEFAAKITADDWSVVSSGQMLVLDETLNGRNYTSIKFPINLENRNLLAGYTIDITEHKIAEDEVKLKNDELIKLNAEKDKFFSIIAHDLRSPFNTLLGFTRLMVEEFPTLTPDDILKIALNMRNSANKLYSLLDNLLEWSQMQQGRHNYQPKSFNFMSKVVPILDSVRETAKNKMIAIGNDFPMDLRVVADENMIASVIRNLLFNAIKFTPKGGNVIIAAKPIPGNEVEVSISDTGIGMNQDLLDKLFKLGEDTRRKGIDGEISSGLGLLICKDFVERHNGKIWVESDEGKGSTFYFTIPRDAEQGKEIDVITVFSQKKTNPIKNLKILVSEDEEESDMFIQAIIKIFSKEIFTAKTGIEAIEICRNNPGIDLVLMDIMMPEMDGYEATRQIRLFNKELIIIAQTSYVDEGAREMAIEAGCNDYIAKPIKKDVLLALIQKYFKK